MLLLSKMKVEVRAQSGWMSGGKEEIYGLSVVFVPGEGAKHNSSTLCPVPILDELLGDNATVIVEYSGVRLYICSYLYSDLLRSLLLVLVPRYSMHLYQNSLATFLTLLQSFPSSRK